MFREIQTINVYEPNSLVGAKYNSNFLINLIERNPVQGFSLMNMVDQSSIDRIQFGPPNGFIDVSASVNVERKANGGIIKTVVITSTMPNSYPNLDAEPTIIEASGLTITIKMQIVNNIVINTYIYDAMTESDMP